MTNPLVVLWSAFLALWRVLFGGGKTPARVIVPKPLPTVPTRYERFLRRAAGNVICRHWSQRQRRLRARRVAA